MCLADTSWGAPLCLPGSSASSTTSTSSSVFTLCPCSRWTLILPHRTLNSTSPDRKIDSILDLDGAEVAMVMVDAAAVMVAVDQEDQEDQEDQGGLDGWTIYEGLNARAVSNGHGLPLVDLKYLLKGTPGVAQVVRLRTR